MFLKQKNPSKKFPFYKRKAWKVTFLTLALFGIIVLSFLVYTLAQGSKIFTSKNISKTALIRTLTGAHDKNENTLNGYKDGRINILFMGMGGANHPGGQLTDSIMVLSIKPQEHALAMLSIPRDLYVPIADHKISAKINEAYSYGEKDKKGGGPALAKTTVSDALGIPIHYYLTADFKGFEKIVDEIGGIDVDIEKAIYDPQYPDEQMIGFDPFSIKAGRQHLDGATALKYARSRHGTAAGDFDRAARQQQVISAIKEKILTLGFLANPKKLFDMVTILGTHVRTDLAPTDAGSLADIFKDLDSDKTVSRVLANTTGGPLAANSSSGTYYLYPREENFEIIQNMAQNIFETGFARNETYLEIKYNSENLDSAQAVSTELMGFGYNTIMNSSGNNDETAIVDYTKGTSQPTIDYLQKKFNTNKVTERTASKDSIINISVVLGSDYPGENQ